MTHLRSHHRTMLSYSRAERRYTKVASLRYEKTLAHREDRANGKALVAEGLDEYALPLRPDECKLSRGIIELTYGGNPLLVAMHRWLEQEAEIMAYRRRELWADYPGFDTSIDSELEMMLRLTCGVSDPDEYDADRYFSYGERSVYYHGRLIGWIRYGTPDLLPEAMETVMSVMQEETE